MFVLAIKMSKSWIGSSRTEVSAPAPDPAPCEGRTLGGGGDGSVNRVPTSHASSQLAPLTQPQVLWAFGSEPMNGNSLPVSQVSKNFPIPKHLTKTCYGHSF